MQEVRKTRVRALEKAVRCARAMSRALTRRACQALVACACLAGAAASVLAAPASAATYYYDELGRLIETVAPDGTSVLYSYDAVGNITSVKHESVSSMGIGGFTPASGSAGTTVTIYGSGFNTTAASNVVKFNGVAANVTTASATALSVTVPSGATTGVLTVTNGSATATSGSAFTVAASGAPTLTSFTPTIGLQGTAVTLTGTNFQTSATTDKVQFGGLQAAVSSATAVSIAISAPGSSGKISVTTPFGVATSTADFFDVPAGFNVADVQFTSRVTLSGAALTASTTVAGKTGLILFDGVGGSVGNYLQLTNVTTPGGSVNVYRPDGTLLTSGSLANALIGLPKLTMTGTYTIVVSPSTPTSLTLSLKPAMVLNVDGQATAISSVGVGYGAYATFIATAGQNLGLGLTGLTLTGGVAASLNVYVYGPDGTQLQGVSCSSGSPGGGCNLVLSNLPLAGTYLVYVQNPNSLAITGGVFTLSSDKTGALTAGTVSSLSLRSGQNGRLSFAGAAGQPATIRFENITTTPANQNVAVTILKPDGTVLAATVNGSTASNGGFLYVPSLPSTGTYAVIATPGFGAVTTMSMTLNPSTGDIVADGAAVNLPSPMPTGTGSSWMFYGTAGQNLGVSINGETASSYVSIAVLQPNGSTWASTSCFVPNQPTSSCDLNLSNLPATGAYLIQVSNNSTTTGGTVTLSNDAKGTLAANSPYALSLRNGQNGRLSFSGTAGQPATIRFENMTTVPANLNVAVTILKPDGTALTSVDNGDTAFNGGAVYVPSLPSTGTYTVFVDPAYGASATLAMTLNPSTGDIVADGAAVNLPSPMPTGTGSSWMFYGTAGQNLGVSINGETAGSYVSIAVLQPNGSTWASTSCFVPNQPTSSCDLNLSNLPATGAYLIQVSNNSTTTGGTVTLSNDAKGTLAANSPYALSLRNGQNGRLSFSGTAGQPATIRFENMTTVPANLNVAVTILKPDGTALTSVDNGDTAFNGGAVYVPSLPSTGTYTVFVDPAYGASATLAMTLNPSTGDIVADGAAVNLPSPMPTGTGSSWMFYGTAGQNLGVSINGETASSYVSIAVLQPNGSTWASTSCFVPNQPTSSCDLNLSNLPATGAYLIQVSNNSTTTGGTVTLSNDAKGTLAANSPYALSLRNGQNGRLSFSGTAGQPATIRFENMTTVPANLNVAVTILKPDGTALTSVDNGDTAFNGGAVYVPSLPSTGTYTVFVDPAYGASATLAMTLNPSTGDIVADGAAVNLPSPMPTGTGSSWMFYGTAGQNLGVSINGETAGSYVSIAVLQPNGSTWASTSCFVPNQPTSSCDLNLSNLPATGAYLIQVSNNSTTTGGTVTLSNDAKGTLAANSPYALSLRNGQNGRLSFSGTAGQPATIRFENMTTVPANLNVAVTILKPDGTALTSVDNGDTAFNGGAVYVPSLPSTGTYTVFVDPAYGASATLAMTLNPSTGDIVADGAAVNLPSPMPTGTGSSWMFYGTAGQNLGVSINGETASSYVSIAVLQPNGSTWASTSCFVPNQPTSSCDLNLSNLPATGAYLIQVSNNSTTTGGTVTLSNDAKGTLAANSPYALSLRNGQNGRLSFSGTAGQPATIRFENMTTVPANLNVAVTILKPDGTALTSVDNGDTAFNGGAVYVPSLPSTGTYTVFVDPAYGASATLAMTLNPSTGDIVADGAAVNLPSPMPTGTGSSWMFYGTAGQNLGVSINGETASSYVSIAVLQPNGSTWASTSCFVPNQPTSSCDLNLSNLPATGAYLIQVSNNSTTTGGTVTLSNDAKGTLAANSPYALSLRNGQNGRLSFSGTAATHTLTIGPVTTVPSSLSVAITVMDSSGNSVASGTFGASGGTLNLGTLTSGIYTVFVDPNYGASSSLSLTFQ